MAMTGFDPEFEDLTDYIIKITKRIWEDRGIDRIYDWYGATAPVFTPAGETHDVNDVVRFTRQTLHMFPDRQLYGEDVIGSEDQPGRHYSSHRILSTMTHLGDGAYGPPTGRKIKTRIIADCVCENNQIIEEWMVRDEAAVLRGLGQHEKDVAFDRIHAGDNAAPSLPNADALEAKWTGGPAGDTAEGDVAHLLDLYEQLWSSSAQRLVSEVYDRAAVIHAPGGETINGDIEIDRLLLGYLASLPHGRFQRHHTIVRQDPGEPVRVAIRWSLRSGHTGFGRFGAPTGKDIVIMAMSHFELRKGKILREFLHIDDLNLWMQVLSEG